MSKAKKIEIGEGKRDYPVLFEYVHPVLRQIAKDRREIVLEHTVDDDGVSTLTIVAQPKPLSDKELADNKATSVVNDSKKAETTTVSDKPGAGKASAKPKE